MNKEELRTKAKGWVKTLGTQEKNRRDQKIASIFSEILKKLITNNPFVLGAYWPFKDEVEWDRQFILPPQVKLAHPFMTEDKNLEYWIFNKRKERKELVQPELLLIPGLMFSLKGERLGRGGGYFDRFLPNYKGRTIGVCYEENIGSFPVEDHDCKVQGILTEEGYRACL